MKAVLDAGWALFLEHGVQAVSVEAIAARAGVSQVAQIRRTIDQRVDRAVSTFLRAYAKKN